MTGYLKILIPIVMGAAYCGAYGQTLAPNAELLLTNRDAGMQRMRIVQKQKAAVPDESKTVNAYIFIDNEDAVSTLENMGVTVRHQYSGYVTATVPVDILRQVGETPGVSYVSLGSSVSLLNDYARSQAGVDDVHANSDNRLPEAYDGSGVVVGIIDTGVEYGHIAYRTADGDGLRLKAVWDQNATRGNSPEAFGYGCEYTTPDEIVGAIYDTNAEFHGSHTMGIAAGGDRRSPYYGVAPGADIVFVSFGDDDSNITDAIRYIFNYADEVNKPCVINMSLGQHIGPHNGTSVLDRFIDEVSGPGRIIVGACGNEGNVRLHATETFTAEDTQLKTMLTFADGVSHKLHYLDVWGTEGTDMKLRICVVESLKGRILAESPAFDTSVPDGETVIKVFYLEDVGADAVAIITGERNPLNGQPHISVQCTVNNLSSGRIMGVIVDGTEGQTVDMWNYSSHEFSSNNKSGWTNGTIYGTVGEIGGTAKRIISVGSFDARDKIYWIDNTYTPMAGSGMAYEQDHHSDFSSCGPTADGRIVPSILAAGNPVVSAINRYAYTAMGFDLNMYTCSCTADSKGIKYYYGYNMGTSMSAPFVAGTVALMLQANPALTPEKAVEIISETAFTDDYMGQLPNNVYGAGRINSYDCVRLAALSSGVEEIEYEYDSDAKVWSDGAGSVFVAAPKAKHGDVARFYSASGALVGTYPLDGTLTTVDFREHSHGIYIVNVENGDEPVSLKIAL